MRRYLFSIACTLLIISLAQYITHLILKWNYDGWSFNAGMITIIMLYVANEIIFNVKDRSKGVGRADITITVKEGSSSKDIEDAFVTGLQTFNSFKNLGNSVINSNNIKKSEDYIDSDDSET